MARFCERATGRPQLVAAPIKNRYTRRGEMGFVQVQPHLYDPLRTLYMREIKGGEAAGWRAVGTVCLKCHEVHLDEERLPEDRRWSLGYSIG
jgi:hypothetical protein